MPSCWGDSARRCSNKRVSEETAERSVAAAVTLVNDFVGHRPVPNLEGHPSRPYAHEFVRPVPIYIRGVGPRTGPIANWCGAGDRHFGKAPTTRWSKRCNLIAEMRELAFDPRAYDFEHPVHRRPGYQFGEWDPHAIGEHKHYYRFVIRKEMLDIVLDRTQKARDEADRQERLVEAAAVTAGSLLSPQVSVDVARKPTIPIPVLPLVAKNRGDFEMPFMSICSIAWMAPCRTLTATSGQRWSTL